MATITIDKENALVSFQKIMKLVSSWKRLEVKIDDKHEKIKKSYKNALKEYERWEFIYWWTVHE